MSEDTTPKKLHFKNPPIVERNIGVYHRIPQETFESRLPSWIERINKEYPVPGHLAEWLLDIEDKNGVPFVKSLVPKASIIHLFWQRHPKNERVRGMRLRPDRLVFHLLREEANSHSFEELLPEMEKWLPLWAEHFGVPDLDGITVEYFNVLDGNITPQFANPDGTLRIGEALTVFSNFPGRHKSLTNPYDCKARLVMDVTKPTYFDVRVRGDDRSQNALKVEFVVRTFPQKRLSFSHALNELRVGHEIVLEQFACFFTKEAQQSFDK